MIIREFVDKDTSGRNRSFTTAICSVCEVEFTRQTRHMNEYSTCSIGCTSRAKGLTVEVICAHCGKSTYRGASRIKGSASGLQFCGRECKEAAQKYNKLIQPDHYGTGTGKLTYREKALAAYSNICTRCGYSNIQALEVHHKDKNRENNELSNLEILCANCHSIEHRIRG